MKSCGELWRALESFAELCQEMNNLSGNSIDSPEIPGTQQKLFFRLIESAVLVLAFPPISRHWPCERLDLRLGVRIGVSTA